MTREFAPAPRIEVIVVRDPDGPTHTQVFVDGVPAAATQFHIDQEGGGRGATGSRHVTAISRSSHPGRGERSKTPTTILLVATPSAAGSVTGWTALKDRKVK